MDLKGEDLPSRRAAVVPPLTSRTLPRASLMPLYLDAGFARYPGAWVSHEVPAITPDEIYYNDPCSGARIPNIVTDFRPLECFRLNTPPPIMTSCLAPPTLPDPFRSRPHPTRDLGSPLWNSDPVQSPPESQSRGIIQLTQAEDQGITNLLKLRHQEPGPGHNTLAVESDDAVTNGPYPRRTGLWDQLQDGRRSWTDAELEAADTLLSVFIPTEGSRVGAQRPETSAETPPDPPTHQENTQGSVPRDSSEVTAEMLSVFEGEAVRGLLCLKDLNILERLFQH